MVKQQRLYIVVFKSKTTAETFIKIGISSHPIIKRFSSDLSSFEIETVIETAFYKPSDARIIESNFHDVLSASKYAPKTRLKSGNTECFVYSDEVIAKITAVLTRKPARSAPKKKRSKLTARQLYDKQARVEAAQALAQRWNTPTMLRPQRKKGERRPGWGEHRFRQFG